MPTNIHLVKAVGFPVVMYWCESWTVKKAWVLKNWCFWIVALEKTFESPLDFKEIQPVHSKGDHIWDFFGRNHVKLKLEYFGHLMQRVDSLENTLMLEGLGAGGEGDDRGWDGLMASLTRWTWVWVSSGSWWWTGRPGVLGSQSRTWLSDWTELNWTDGTRCHDLSFLNVEF